MKQPSWQKITDQRAKKNIDLDHALINILYYDHAHAMGRVRTKVGGSIDALSSYV